MKPDAQLQQDVLDELAWDPAVRSAERIGVSVQQGVVTLTGHIETYADRLAIEKALRRVAGVKAVALELDVRLSPTHQRSDTEIALAIERAWGEHTLVPAERLRVSVERGWVRLSGEVDWDYQREAAYLAAHPVPGVVGISNEIAIRHQATTGNIAGRIEEALKRQASRESHRIQVEVDGAKVTLRGHVHSWHEREAAQGAAWSAPGVRVVVNELSVGD